MRYILFFLIAPSLLMPLFIACQDEGEVEPPYPYSLWIEGTENEMAVGETLQLVAFLLWSDGSANDVTEDAGWAVSEVEVASVDKGAVTGIYRGTVDITATYQDWTSNTYTVTVIPELLSIEITPESAEIVTGETVEFTALGYYSDGVVEEETTGVLWRSSDEEVASITSIGGILTAVDFGEVEVWAEKDEIVSNTSIVTVTGYATILEGDIVFNEVLVDVPVDSDVNGDGVADTTEDEFIEFANWQGYSLDISGCTITETDIPEIPRHTFPEGTILRGGEAVVVFGGGEVSEDLLAITGAAFYTANAEDPDLQHGLALTNDGDTVTLTCGGVATATFEYGEGTGLDAEIDMSLQRNPDITGNFFEPHAYIDEANGALFSPGTKLTGDYF